jgi:hypothetical protein
VRVNDFYESPFTSFSSASVPLLEADEQEHHDEPGVYKRFTVDDILNLPVSDATFSTTFISEQRGGWNQLLEHPKVVQKLEEFLQQRWTELAYGGIYVSAATAQPHRELKRGEVYFPDKPHGCRIMVFRSPVANSADVRTFTNNIEGIRTADSEGFRQRGIGYMNPEDAADLKIDFDGDAPVFESDEEIVSNLTPHPLEYLKSHEICIPGLPNGQVVTLYHSRTQKNRFTNNTSFIPEDGGKRAIYLNPGTLEGMNTKAAMSYGYYTADGLHGFKTLCNEVDELNQPGKRPIQTVKRTKIPRDANHPKLAKFSSEDWALATPFDRIEKAAIHAAHNPTGRVANVGMRLEALRHDLTYALKQNVETKLELYKLIQAKAKSILKTQAQFVTNRARPILNPEDQIQALQPHLRDDPTAYEDLTQAVNQWIESTEEVCVPRLVAYLNQWFVEEGFMDTAGDAPVQITPNDLRDWINVDALLARTKADLIPPPTASGYDFYQALDELTANLSNGIKIGRLQAELNTLQDAEKEQYLKGVAKAFQTTLKYNASLIPTEGEYNFQKAIETISRIPTLINATDPTKRIQQVNAHIPNVQTFLEQLAQLDSKKHEEFRKAFTNYRKQDDLIGYEPQSVGGLDQALLKAQQLIVQIKGLIDDELQKAVDTPKSARPIDGQILDLASDIARYKTIGWVKYKKDKETFTTRWVEQEGPSRKTFKALGVPDNDTRDPIGNLIEVANHHFVGSPLEQQPHKVYSQLLKAQYTSEQQAIAQQVVQNYSTDIAPAIGLEEQAELEEGPKLRLTSKSGNYIDVTNLPLFDPSGTSPVWDAVHHGEPVTITLVTNELEHQVFLPQANLALKSDREVTRLLTKNQRWG